MQVVIALKTGLSIAATQLKRPFLIVSILTWFYTSGVSQTVPLADQTARFPGVNIVSPTATALAKYVDFPVNLHTGIPEISIPIYTVQEGPLQLPVSLSYHAAGLQVMEAASWVGAGWSLNAGGVVTRTVKGIPDEEVGEEDPFSFYSYGGYSNFFTKPNGDNSGLDHTDYWGLNNGRKDPEPDLFTFNFGGYGGKFYIREDGIPMLIPEGDYKVETILKKGPDGNTVPNNSRFVYDFLQGFKITTPDGVKWYFGMTQDDLGDVDPVEKTRSKNVQEYIAHPTSISSWYLNKIQSADSEFEIKISYRTETFAYYTLVTQPCMPNCDRAIVPTKILVEGVAIEKIYFSTGSVEFLGNVLREDVGRNEPGLNYDVPNVSAKSLDEIKIFSKPQASQLTHQRSIKFTYSYFYDDSTQPLPYLIVDWGGTHTADRKRLKLDAIQEIAGDNSIATPSYRFYYYQENQVPRRMSFAQDHWGFFNGAVANETLNPPTSADNGVSYSDGANRESNWPAMRAGALKLIQYPTGGSTEYSYEPNSTQIIRTTNFTKTNEGSTNINAGMGTANEESATYPLPFLSAPNTIAYFFNLHAQGGGARGTLYIDGEKIATVDDSNPTIQDYFVLTSGPHQIKITANADNGSGVGVLLAVQTAATDPPLTKLVGGLRIKRIDKYPGKHSAKLSKSYVYDGGNLYSVPVYVLKLKNELLKSNMISTYSPAMENGCPTTGNNADKTYIFQSPVAIQPLQSIQGYHIGYRKVREVDEDGGYTNYEYNGSMKLPANWYTLEDVSVRKIDNRICSKADPEFPAAPLPFDFNRGLLKSIQIFDKNDKKLKEVTYTSQYTENPIGVFGVALAYYPDDDGAPVLANHYDVRSGRQNWKKETEQTWDDSNNSITKETTTIYNSTYHRMPTKTTQTTQKGIEENQYFYVSDLTECKNGCMNAQDYLDAAQALYDEYLAKIERCKVGNCSGEFLGIQAPLGPCVGENNTVKKINCRVSAWVDYQYRLNLARKSYSLQLKGCTQLVNTCLSSGLLNSQPDIKALFVMDRDNQLQTVETIQRRDNVFQSGNYFDFTPDPADGSKVHLKNIYTTESNFSLETFIPAYIYPPTGRILKNSQYGISPYQSYVFENGQPVEIKNRAGIVTSYIWELNHTAPVVKAVGVDYATLSSAYSSSPANIRDNNALSKSQITTYSYEPAVGIKSVTDPNGKMVQYEYDKLGRLVRIKDHDGKILEEYEYKYGLD